MKLTKIALSLALIGTLSLAMAEDVATTDTTTDTTTQTTTDATTTDTTTTTDATTDTTTTDTTVSVDAEIEAIQAAPAQERVRLMNQFKRRLMQMNEAERSAAIAAMQEKMQASQTMQATTTADAQAQKAMVQTRAMEHANEMQMQTNEEMNQVQNMNQHRFANQVMNMPGNAPATVAPMGGNVAPTTQTVPSAGAGQNFNMTMPARR